MKFKNPMIHFDDEEQNMRDCTYAESETHEYIKKPIPILALKAWFSGYINTPEGIMRFKKGDYLVEGIEGEHYPIKESIFKKTYEETKK